MEFHKGIGLFVLVLFQREIGLNEHYLRLTINFYHITENVSLWFLYFMFMDEFEENEELNNR